MAGGFPLARDALRIDRPRRKSTAGNQPLQFRWRVLHADIRDGRGCRNQRNKTPQNAAPWVPSATVSPSRPSRRQVEHALQPRGGQRWCLISVKRGILSVRANQLQTERQWQWLLPAANRKLINKAFHHKPWSNVHGTPPRPRNARFRQRVFDEDIPASGTDLKTGPRRELAIALPMGFYFFPAGDRFYPRQSSRRSAIRFEIDGGKKLDGRAGPPTIDGSSAGG